MTEQKFIVHLVWSNFEIADMDFWRGEAYQKFFEYLDSTGGFYYEVKPDDLTPGLLVFNCFAEMGRCACAQHRSSTFFTERPDPFLP
jgi:hypothetical protein